MNNQYLFYMSATFNVLAHNRDDHAKNFTYLMTGAGEWRLSPAYDQTARLCVPGRHWRRSTR